jgi:hypothetical protein
VQPAAIKPLINLSQLEALDIRVGTIESIHDVASSPGSSSTLAITSVRFSRG